MSLAPSHRSVGITTLLFAACPTIELTLIAAAVGFGNSGDHLPVGIGVPPIWMFLLVFFMLSLPWWIAGLLLLRGSTAGRWLALVLTLPSVVIVLMFGGGAIHGFCLGWLVLHDQNGLWTAIAFGLLALFGLLFCVTTWWFQISLWRDSGQKLAGVTNP